MEAEQKTEQDTEKPSEPKEKENKEPVVNQDFENGIRCEEMDNVDNGTGFDLNPKS